MADLETDRSTPPVAAGDAAAVFVQAQQAGVWRFLRALGCARDLADDLAQDALLLGLQRGLHRSADGAAAAAFLRQTAKHLWLRLRRDRSRRARLLAEAAASLWQRDCALDGGEAFLDALRECLRALPERSRRALESRYAAARSRGAMAEEFGLGEHGVRTLLQRVRQALRVCVERRLQQ